jgi:hypothetical protein
MYELLKDLADLNGWVFEYSRSDYQNLYDEMTNDKLHLFVDPITIDSTFSDSGTESKSYSGKYMLLVSSDIDETYKDKYINHIKPIIDTAATVIKQSFICDESTINKYSQVEVINIFDFNLDGVLVTYNVTLID